ncbi:MAG: hypothetical protein HYT82_01545 [Candidatus Harrisonbacteria bacterium]|nr:hypothetical protein [Candidatus Harrisonbacteria bacterium]
MALDQKTKDTVVWSAVYNGVATAAESIISNIAFSALLGYRLSVVGGVANAAVNGAIIGAVVGYVLSQWYPKVLDINAKYLGNKFNTLFKILFYPYLIGAVLTLLSSIGLASVFGLAPLVAAAGTVAARYAYAKLLTAKVGQYYPAAPQQ